jgi:hypothetical protein
MAGSTKAIFNRRGIVLIDLAAERGEGDTHGRGRLYLFGICV